MNTPTADQITIAITVFERTDYVIAAIESALLQTVPVRVIVVEDCANTDRVRDLVTAHFGERITYYKNPVRRGIFGNWNACCAYAGTEWISILHDDDLLAPDFVASMIQLGVSAGPMGAYFCRPNILDPSGTLSELAGYDFPTAWCKLDLAAFAQRNLVLFPGQLLYVPGVQSIGGFNERSQFAGDWDMWFKLAYHFGAAQTRAVSATVRTHQGTERGTNRVVRSGRKFALDFVQARRNVALLRRQAPNVRFVRSAALKESPLSIRETFAFLPDLSPRMARCNWALLLQSTPPNIGYALIRIMARWIGPRLLQELARILRHYNRTRSRGSPAG